MRARARVCVCDPVAVGCHTRMHLRLFAVKCWAASQGSGERPAIQQEQQPTTAKRGTFLEIVAVWHKWKETVAFTSTSDGHLLVQK